MEKHWHQNVSVFPPNSSVDTDSLSVMVHSDEELVSDCEDLDAALKPPVRADEPPIRANEPPTKVSEPQSGANKTPDEAVKRPNVSANAGDLYDPDSQHPSWEPQADLTAFLQKHFHRKLSYDQVSNILDSYSIPSIDCLFSPTLDNSVLNQISPFKSRKYIQERDKELASVQSSMLNITGPLCRLHDALCSDQDVSKDDIKSVLEQSLCLLGSANFQFSALRRKKILVAINKDKIGLADQPLPNAKRLLFGDDFPSTASKEADLSRGLAKNLGAASRPVKRPCSGSLRPLTGTSTLLVPTLSTTAVQKTGVPFVPPNRRQKTRLIHRQLEGNNLPPRHPQYCVRLQNSVALQASLVYHTSYKSQPSKCRPHDSEVENLLTKGAIAEIPPIREGFLSRLFLVPKNGGTFRPVIDLSFLNKFVENSQFQMESIHCLKSLLQKGDYMITLDLKDAYLSVPVHKDSQKFLQFLWRNKCYAFQGLCFGLNTTPRVFTKLLKPVAAFLCKRGVCMILYLDDFLILGSTCQEAQSHTAMAVSLLESLGFTVNLEKSCLILTQILTFLGFVIDSTVEALSLPQEKVVKVKSLCLKARMTPTMSTRQLASVLGTLQSCRPAIWQAPLHFRYLQIRLIQALHASNQNFDVTITLDDNYLEDLHWWVSNINFVNSSPIRPPAPTLFITTDASTTEWGVVCESQCTNRCWSDSERTQHIKVLELKAAFLALKSCLKNQSHKTVCLRMDNTMAVAHVKNKGGTHSPCLLALTLALWQWCLERNIMISAQHVPGKLNTIADSESRVFNDSSEWKLDPQTISPFLKGCEINLFASRLYTQLSQYVSWRPDPEALHTDALTMAGHPSGVMPFHPSI